MTSAEIKGFIKRHVRSVDPAFVDDFFGRHDLYTSPHSFSIDLAVTAKWLRTTKGNLKKTLLRSYVADKHYQITKPFKGRRQGKIEVIMITPDCFKELCLASHTEKGREVREYYVRAEASFIEHRNDIVHAKDERIAELELNQRPRPRRPTKKGIIYITRAHPKLKLFKIGKTVHEYDRMASHNRAHADDVMLPIVTYETDHVDQVEACMKLLLRGRQYRKGKEVYEITLPKLKELTETCGKACLTVASRRRMATMDGGGGDTASWPYFAVVVKQYHEAGATPAGASRRRRSASSPPSLSSPPPQAVAAARRRRCTRPPCQRIAPAT